MSLTWTLEDRADHLLVRARGSWQLQGIFRMLDEMAARCRGAGYGRILLDARDVNGPLAEITRFAAGARVAEVLKTIKVALLAHPDALITGLGSRVAASRGGQLFVTKSEDEARQWLFA